MSVICAYAHKSVDVAKDPAHVTITYCREVLLKDSINFFRRAERLYETNNYYAGYDTVDCSDIESFANLNKTIKKLFNVNVKFSYSVEVNHTTHRGIFFKYTPTKDMYFLTKATTSAILLLIKHDNVLDYLINRNTAKVPIDTILLRLLNRTKSEYDADDVWYQKQLQHAILYIKYLNDGEDHLIDTTYYNGVMSYVTNMIKLHPGTKQGYRDYIDSLIGQIHIPSDYYKISNEI